MFKWGPIGLYMACYTTYFMATQKKVLDEFLKLSEKDQNHLAQKIWSIYNEHLEMWGIYNKNVDKVFKN